MLLDYILALHGNELDISAPASHDTTGFNRRSGVARVAGDGLNVFIVVQDYEVRQVADLRNQPCPSLSNCRFGVDRNSILGILSNMSHS